MYFIRDIYQYSISDANIANVATAISLIYYMFVQVAKQRFGLSKQTARPSIQDCGQDRPRWPRDCGANRILHGIMPNKEC